MSSSHATPQNAKELTELSYAAGMLLKSCQQRQTWRFDPITGDPTCIKGNMTPLKVWRQHRGSIGWGRARRIATIENRRRREMVISQLLAHCLLINDEHGSNILPEDKAPFAFGELNYGVIPGKDLVLEELWLQEIAGHNSYVARRIAYTTSGVEDVVNVMGYDGKVNHVKYHTSPKDDIFLTKCSYYFGSDLSKILIIVNGECSPLEIAEEVERLRTGFIDSSLLNDVEELLTEAQRRGNINHTMKEKLGDSASGPTDPPPEIIKKIMDHLASIR